MAHLTLVADCARAKKQLVNHALGFQLLKSRCTSEFEGAKAKEEAANHAVRPEELDFCCRSDFARVCAKPCKESHRANAFKWIASKAEVVLDMDMVRTAKFELEMDHTYYFLVYGNLAESPSGRGNIVKCGCWFERGYLYWYALIGTPWQTTTQSSLLYHESKCKSQSPNR